MNSLKNKAGLLWQKYRKASPLIRFFIHIVLLAALWYFFYHVLRRVDKINDLYEIGVKGFTNLLLYISKYVLDILGYDVMIFPSEKKILLAGSRAIIVERGCLGRDLMGLFSGIILAFPGKIKSKIWFIPLGWFLISFINVIRITGLSLLYLHYPDGYLKYDHHAIFNYSIYILTFILWVIWIRKYGSISRQKAPIVLQKENESPK